MNTQITTAGHGATATWTPRQLAVIKSTVAKDTNADEFDLFIEYARVKGLDPFSRQVIAIVFNKGDAKKRQMTIITPQDGLRVQASRCSDYRPADEEPIFTLTDYETIRREARKTALGERDPKKRQEALRSVERDFPTEPTNPAGIERATVFNWKQDKLGQWHKVMGTARWMEFAPLSIDPRCFEYVDTGDVWPDSNRPKKRKQLKEGINPTEHQMLDDSGQWAKMPYNQIAKCANCASLRAGWPETFSGVYGEEEMDRARVLDLTATEMVEMEEQDRRQRAIAQSKDEYAFVDDHGALIFIPAGQFMDHILNMASGYGTRTQLDLLRSRNRESLQRFWASHKSDALELKKQLETIEQRLPKQAEQKALVEA